MTSRDVARAAGLIAALTLASRAAGLVRTLVFAESVRAAGVGQVYASTNAVPNVVYEVAAGGVLAAIAVPVIAGSLGAGRREDADASASAMLTWVLAILVPLGLLLALAADPVAGWLLHGGSPAAVGTGATMLRIFAVQVPLYGIGIVLSGLLQAHRRFLLVALAPLLSSLVVIGSYLWYGALAGGRTDPGAVSPGAVAVLAWGTTAGVAALSLPLLVPAWRVSWRWRPTWRLPAGLGRRTRDLAIAGALGLAAQSGAVLATNWLSNAAVRDGTMPVYQYVQAVYLLPYAVLAVPVAMSAFPSLAQMYGAGVDPSAMLAGALRVVVLLMGLAAAVLVAVAVPVGAFFTALDARRGAAGASPEALGALPDALTAYTPGVLGLGVAALLTRALYVRGHALGAGGVVAGGWAVAALVPLALVTDTTSSRSALLVLGLASSAGLTLAAAGLVLLVVREWGSPAVGGAGRSLVVAVVAAGLAGAAGRAAAAAWPATGIGASLVAGLAIGAVVAAVFLALAILLDRPTATAALARLRRA